MDIPLTELLGLKSSSTPLAVILTPGNIVRWLDILTLSSVVFAISEFVEKDKLRAFVLRYGGGNNVYWLMAASLISVIGANIVSFAPLWEDGNPTPFIGYPAFWELVSLFLSSVLIFLVLFYSLRLPIPKITKSNSSKWVTIINRKILNEASEDSFSVVATLIDHNLEFIIKNASLYERFQIPEASSTLSKADKTTAKEMVQLIDLVLSDKNFCVYLSRNNIGFVLRLVDSINKHQLWSSCGQIFFDSLCKELFMNTESHLSRETEFRGVGVHEPVYKTIFCSLGIVAGYRPFQSVEFWKIEKIPEEVLAKYTKALEISLTEYYLKGNYFDSRTSLHLAFDRLINVMRSMCIKVQHESNCYQNLYANNFMEIYRLFSRVDNIIEDSKNLKTHQEFESKVQEGTLTNDIAESIFEYLNTLAMLDDEDYARFLSCAVFWAIYPVNNNELAKNMEKKLLPIIKDRVEENKKEHYASIIPLLINIYGLNNNEADKDCLIAQFIREEFKTTIAPAALGNPDKRDRYVPKDFQIEPGWQTIKDSKGNEVYSR